MKKVITSSLLLACIFSCFAEAQIRKVVDTDDDSTVYYITGKLPNSWVISTSGDTKGSGATLFVASKLVKKNSSIIESKCVWYENANESGTRLKRTVFVYTYTPSNNFSSSAQLGFNSPAGSGLWLQTLDSLCMFKTPSASISTVSMPGNYFEPSELPNMAVIKYISSSGKQTIKIVPR